MPLSIRYASLALRTLVCYTAVFSVVTQRSSPLWEGAFRDDTKNGCVADYAYTVSIRFDDFSRL